MHEILTILSPLFTVVIIPLAMLFNVLINRKYKSLDGKRKAKSLYIATGITLSFIIILLYLEYVIGFYKNVYTNINYIINLDKRDEQILTWLEGNVEFIFFFINNIILCLSVLMCLILVVILGFTIKKLLMGKLIKIIGTVLISMAGAAAFIIIALLTINYPLFSFTINIIGVSYIIFIVSLYIASWLLNEDIKFFD
ncbi:MAG: hypothetical protein FWD38_11660 [Oscillospiraceae bacterium]|nr:hypothetical protein [Oscillospiraceae bacterium]